MFPNTDIKGGVLISLRDNDREFGSIKTKFAPAGIYIPFKDLLNIMRKVTSHNFESFSSIIYGRNIYRFTKKMHEEHPEAKNKLSKGHAFDLSSNIFQRVPELFYDEKPKNVATVGIAGRFHNQRVTKFIKRAYIKPVANLDKYKVFVPKANGTGALGEVISTPLIGSTETFISIGCFDTRQEAEDVMKYVKTKFARALLGILKVTQDNTQEKWRLVPMQDFTSHSDIDWSKTIHDIDQQLYKKYNLSDDEIHFIETKVQAMN